MTTQDLPAAAPPGLKSETPHRESLAALFGRLIDDIVGLVRTEFQLARSEVGAKVSEALGSVAAIAVGGMLALVSTSCLLVATIAWLAEHVGLVFAALIVGGVLAVAAGILIAGGVTKLQRVDLAPKRAVANLKRDVETLQGD